MLKPPPVLPPLAVPPNSWKAEVLVVVMVLPPPLVKVKVLPDIFTDLLRLIWLEVDPMFKATAEAVSKVGAIKLVAVPLPEILKLADDCAPAFWF